MTRFIQAITLVGIGVLVLRKLAPTAVFKLQLPAAHSLSTALPREMVGGIIAGVLFVAGLFVILSKNYPPETEKWAYGAVGTGAGFWLA